MADNAGFDYDQISELIKDKDVDVGFNFLSGEVVDMYEAGIIDPAKVTKNALRNAVSAAGTLLTTNFAIIEDDA